MAAELLAQLLFTLLPMAYVLGWCVGDAHGWKEANGDDD
jgi:hypothetical protein